MTAEFSFRVPGTAWSAWTALTGANLAAAIPALTGYVPGIGGLESRMRITANGADDYRIINQISLPTTIDPTLWTVGDATMVLRGPAATDVTTLYRSSDNAVLATFIGGGTKELTVGSNFLLQAYFVRRTAGGVELVRNQAHPITLLYGTNGNVDLFYGSEIQLADASTLSALDALITARLDAAISTRAAQTTADSIQAKTTNLPPIPASQGDVVAVGSAVAAIPTNPLLTSDTRLNHLDADVSTAGNPSATAAAVWANGSRTLTSAAGLTPTQAATLDQIASDVAALPSDPASQSTILAAIDAIEPGGGGGGGGITLAEIEASTVLAKEATGQAIKVKTDGLTFTGSDVRATLDGEVVAIAAGSLVPLPIHTMAARIRHPAHRAAIVHRTLTARLARTP